MPPFVVRRSQSKSIQLGPDSWSVLASTEQTENRFVLMEAEISQFEGPPLHVHHDQDDAILVLDGILKMQVGDELFDLHPGDFACASRGTPHTFTNVESTPARVVNLMTPGGFDHALLELSGMPPGPPDPVLLEEMGKRHGFSFAGPTIAVRLGLVGAK